MTEDIHDPLLDYCQRTFPEKDRLEIENLVALNEGWESVIYTFQAVSGPWWRRRSQGLVLRLYPGTDATEKSRREFEGLKRLYDLGYPVPQVYAIENEHLRFGKPFLLMERIEGQMLWRVLDQASPERTRALLTRFCELFVQLHALDWRAFVPGPEQPRYEDAYHPVDSFLGQLEAFSGQFPDLRAFQPVFEWLSNHRDEMSCPEPAPVHWDFHPGNVLLDPKGKMTVIDWTQIQVSDPRFDLGWTLLLAGAYIGEEIREFILAEYERIAGIEVEGLVFFDVANAVKRLGSVLVSLSAGADQMGMRPDAVAAMQRDFPSLRWVYDLLVRRTGIRLLEIEDLLAGD